MGGQPLLYGVKVIYITLGGSKMREQLKISPNEAREIFGAALPETETIISCGGYVQRRIGKTVLCFAELLFGIVGTAVFLYIAASFLIRDNDISEAIISLMFAALFIVAAIKGIRGFIFGKKPVYYAVTNRRAVKLFKGKVIDRVMLSSVTKTENVFDGEWDTVILHTTSFTKIKIPVGSGGERLCCKIDECVKKLWEPVKD